MATEKKKITRKPMSERKMKFRAVAFPGPDDTGPGLSFVGVVNQVLPNQSMSLEEILTRFTRGEPLQVGRETFGEHADDDKVLQFDLEKIATSDLVDKAAFTDRLKHVSEKYERQERTRKFKEAKQRQDAEVEAKVKERLEAAKKNAEQSSAPLA